MVQEGNIQYQSYSTLSQSAFEAKSENVRFEQSAEAKSEFRSEEKSSLIQSSEVAASSQKKMSICSQEIGKMHMDAQSMVKHLQEILEDQDHQDRCPSPTPLDEAMKLATQEAEKAQPEVQRISEQAIQKIEQEKQWANYQAEGKDIVNQHLQKVKDTGLAFLRSHSTPVSELESLYEQQQKEIESQKQRIISLGSAKENESNEDKKKEIEEQIIASQKQIIESQEKQKEIERKKHVRFQEEAEVKRRESLVVQQLGFEETRRIREAQQIQQEQSRRYEEAQKRSIEERQQIPGIPEPNRLFGLEALRESAKTPVAALEAYERDDNMSMKTEKIFHTYEQLIQSEDEIQAELVVKPETPKPLPPIRPLTPARTGSPFPGSIPLAEKSLLLKNIQGIQFEFEQANPKKPEPKKFKLPDLRNLGKTKPLTFSQAPSSETVPKPEFAAEEKTGTESEFQQKQQFIQQQQQQQQLLQQQQQQQQQLQLIQQQQQQQQQLIQQQQQQQLIQQQQQQVEFQQKQQLVQQQLKEVEETRKQTEFQEQIFLQNQYQGPNVIDQRKFQIQQEKLQQQQIKEQRKQVHEELAQNERFKRKQETLGPPKSFERSKTPVAELEEQDRNRAQTERTKQIFSTYDQVMQSEERPRSRIGQPIPEAQSLTEAEKSLFFQNIQGINYEFENITELSATKHLAEHEKSQFIKSVENRTKSPITVGVNTYTKVPTELTQQPVVQPKPDIFQSAFVNALTTVPDSGAKQFQSQKSYEEYKEEQERLYQQQKLEQQKYYDQQRQLQLQKQAAIPKDLVSALTIAPDRPYSPLPSAPCTIPQKVPLPEQTAPYAPSGETKSMIDALTIAPEKPFAPQVFDAGSIDSAILNTERKVETLASNQRRQSASFPGINVQRTPYQMLKGAQIKTSFEEELKTQESALAQFLSKKEETSQSTTTVESSLRQEFQSYSQQSSSSTFQASIAPGFGLVPSSPQIAYAPPPPAEKRAELAASQAKFGPQVEVKPEKPKQEPKPLARPMTMIEALMIAPDRAYSPFPEVPKPQATLVCGGAAVALTKGQAGYESQQQQAPQSHIEVKPIYQVKDVQMSKDKIGATGTSEERKEKQQEAGIIQGEGITGAYQKSEERYESVQQYSGEKKAQKIEIPPLPLPPIVEQDTPKTPEMKSFPPVSDQLKSETQQSVQQSSQQRAVITQSASQQSFSQSSIQQSAAQQVSQKVTRSEDSNKIVERRVTEVIESEHSRKEFSQVKVTGDIDPRTGLRRTSSENFLKSKSQSQQSSSSGLSKPSSIPLYQSLLSDQPVVETVPVGAVESKNFQSRPRSVPSGIKPSKSTDRVPEKGQDVKVPLAFRSRTPVPLPTVTFAGSDPAKLEPLKNRNLPTYNQTEVYRSCSPRPIPVPKQQLGTYFGQQSQPAPKQTLKPGAQSVFRSTSPVPVPKLLGSTERYQQPITRRQVQPKEQPQPRVSWPPQSTSEPLPASGYTPKKIGESAPIPQQPAPTKAEGKKVSWPPKEPTVEILRQEELPEVLSTGNIVKDQINLQEQQASKNIKILSESQKTTTQSLLSKTSLQGKGISGPKSDPITAPRPFGTPTPQRKNSHTTFPTH